MFFLNGLDCSICFAIRICYVCLFEMRYTYSLIWSKYLIMLGVVRIGKGMQSFNLNEKEREKMVVSWEIASLGPDQIPAQRHIRDRLATAQSFHLAPPPLDSRLGFFVCRPRRLPPLFSPFFSQAAAAAAAAVYLPPWSGSPPTWYGRARTSSTPSRSASSTSEVAHSLNRLVDLGFCDLLFESLRPCSLSIAAGNKIAVIENLGATEVSSAGCFL